MNDQSGPAGCTEQTSGPDLLVGLPRAHSVPMGASCARARGALHANVYSIQIRILDNPLLLILSLKNHNYKLSILDITFQEKM